MSIGLAVDDAVSLDLMCKKDTGNLLPDAEVKDLAADAARAHWAQGVELGPEYRELGEKKAQADLIDTSVALAALHHAEVAPAIIPTHIQRKWNLEIRGLPIELTGIIDIQEGTAAVRDTKTSGKAPPKELADTSLQLTMYALAVRQHDGKIPDAVALDYLVHTKKPKVVPLRSRRTDEDFNPLFERIYQASIMIEKGLFMPCLSDAWWCSERFCGYWKTCRYAARPITVAMAGEE